MTSRSSTTPTWTGSRADELIACRVAAVVNAAKSITGRYPNLGPRLLLEAGHPAARRRRPRGAVPGHRGRRRPARRGHPRTTRATRSSPRACCRPRPRSPRRCGEAERRRAHPDRRVRRQHARVPPPRARPAHQRHRPARARHLDEGQARARGRPRLPLPGGPARPAALHPRVPPGAARRGRRRRRAARGRLPAARDHRRHGLGLRRRAAGSAPSSSCTPTPTATPPAWPGCSRLGLDAVPLPAAGHQRGRGAAASPTRAAPA